MLNRAPFLGRLVEEALDPAYIRLRLGQLFPGRAHQRIVVLPLLLGAVADTAYIAVESGALLRIQIELHRHLAIALGEILPRRRRMQPAPYRAGNETQIQHQRDRQQCDPEPGAPRASIGAAGRDDAHVRMPSVRSRTKPLEGSSMSRTRLSSGDCTPGPKAAEVMLPRSKPSQLATTSAAASPAQRATPEKVGCGRYRRGNGIIPAVSAGLSPMRAQARARRCAGATSPVRLRSARARAAATSAAASGSWVNRSATRSCSSGSSRPSAKPARSRKRSGSFSGISAAELRRHSSRSAVPKKPGSLAPR